MGFSINLDFESSQMHLVGRKLLHLQGRLPEVNARGEAYQNHGKTHQYLWNQYLIEHPEQVRQL